MIVTNTRIKRSQTQNRKDITFTLYKVTELCYNVIAITMITTEPGQVGNEAAIRWRCHVW